MAAIENPSPKGAVVLQNLDRIEITGGKPSMKVIREGLSQDGRVVAWV